MISENFFKQSDWLFRLEKTEKITGNQNRIGVIHTTILSTCQNKRKILTTRESAIRK